MLNKSLLIAVLSLTPIAAVAQAPATPGGSLLAQLLGEQAAVRQWIEYRSAEGGYRVEMPSAPNVKPNPIGLPDGRLAPMTLVDSSKGPLAFLSSHIVYPEGYLHPDRQRVLESVRNGSAKGKTLVRERRLLVSGLPGLEYVVISEGVYNVVRSTLVGDRLYQLVVSGGSDADFDKEPDVQRFLNSFKLASGFSLP